MSTQQNNNKRIVKNTLLLYVRMFFLMFISLFTSRVILNTLGVEDFGTYNVVGGVVSMFSAFSGMFTGAISRFITFELGKNKGQRLSDVFSTSVTIQIGIAFIFVCLAEVIGLYFLNYKLVIPSGRWIAANWVLQCSILTFAVNLISIPYNAAIIAHERMSAFAYISIFEVLMKLLIVYALYISPVDKLISYAILLMILSVVIRFIYGNYCSRHFEECKYRFTYDKSLLKEMSSFAGWNFLGSGAYILNTQGINILINMFFGVTLNAARGVANQVDHAIMQLVQNFMTALKPQITKNIASNNFEYVEDLVCRGAKFGYFLMLFFFVPIYVEAPQILTVWLKLVPDYAISFVRLAMIASMVDLLGTTISTTVIATGNVKRYYIVIGLFGLLVFPITYICFRSGCSPQSCYYAFIGVYLLLLYLKLRQVHKLINFPIWKYIKDVLLKILPITLFSLVPSLILSYYLNETLYRLVIIVFVSFSLNLFAIYFFGLKRTEKRFISEIFLKKN